MSITSHFKDSKIPLWINLMQVILIIIMLSQVYMYFFDHVALEATGMKIEGIPTLNLIYEMGARTLVMALISIFVIFTQEPKYYLVVLIMNVLREGFETIIDPLYPVLNAPASPTADFWIHIIIVGIELFALFAIIKIIRKNRIYISNL